MGKKFIEVEVQGMGSIVLNVDKIVFAESIVHEGKGVVRIHIQEPVPGGGQNRMLITKASLADLYTLLKSE